MSRTRLQKLVYLCDVEHYRKYGRTLSGVEWVFLHYGPYAAELQDTVAQLVDLDEIEEKRFTAKTNRAGYTYRPKGRPEDLDSEGRDLLRPHEQKLIDSVVAEWGLESFNRLLDFVYFETEPMTKARRGEPLDFTAVQPERPQTPGPRASLPPGVVERLKHSLKQRQKQSGLPRPTPPPLDAVYKEAQALLRDHEDLPVILRRARIRER